jgi:hypothetical protein
MSNQPGRILYDSRFPKSFFIFSGLFYWPNTQDQTWGKIQARSYPEALSKAKKLYPSIKPWVCSISEFNRDINRIQGMVINVT